MRERKEADKQRITDSYKFMCQSKQAKHAKTEEYDHESFKSYCQAIIQLEQGSHQV